MTSQKSYFKPRILLNTIRRGWPTSLLFFIILFFTMPVLQLIIAQSWSLNLNDTNDNLAAITGTTRCITCFIALFAGISCFRFMQNRTSAYYYHSLPVSREAHYLHAWATGFCSYLLPLLANTLICQIIMISNQMLDVNESGLLWQGAAQNVVYFLLFFGVTVLAGVLCGTSAVQFVISLTVIYIIPIYHVSAVLLMRRYLPFFNDANYLTFDVFNKLSFGVRAFTSANKVTVNSVENIVYLALIIVMLVTGMIVFRYRRAERAGLPFIFPRFGSVVKYIVMVPAMILSGVVFGEGFSNGSEFWRIFGYVCGALLTFMLVNAIAHKNAKAMFSNFRGFLIFAALSAAVLAIITFDTLGINNYIPSEKITESVTVEMSDIPKLNFTDEEGISDTIALIKAVQNNKLKVDNDTPLYDRNTNYIEFGEGDDYNAIFDNTQINYIISVSFKTRFGLNIEKKYYITQNEKAELELEMRSFADTPQFNKAYLEKYLLTENNIVVSYTNNYGLNMHLNDDQIAELIKAGTESINWNYFQRFRLGMIMINNLPGSSNIDHIYERYPVMNGDAISKILTSGEFTIDEYEDKQKNSISRITVVNKLNGKYKTYLSDMEKELILEGNAGVSTSIFTATDNNYRIIIYSTEDDAYMDYNVLDPVFYAEDEETYMTDDYLLSDNTCLFLRGMVPSFVLEDLS